MGRRTPEPEPILVDGFGGTNIALKFGEAIFELSFEEFWVNFIVGSKLLGPFGIEFGTKGC